MTKQYSRYVVFKAYDNVGHRVDEQKTMVYTVTTHCGLSFNYPSKDVSFTHHKAFSHTYPICRECDEHVRSI